MIETLLNILKSFYSPSFYHSMGCEREGTGFLFLFEMLLSCMFAVLCLFLFFSGVSILLEVVADLRIVELRALALPELNLSFFESSEYEDETLNSAIKAGKLFIASTIFTFLAAIVMSIFAFILSIFGVIFSNIISANIDASGVSRISSFAQIPGIFISLFIIYYFSQHPLISTLGNEKFLLIPAISTLYVFFGVISAKVIDE